jgi:hypothetical protein
MANTWRQIAAPLIHKVLEETKGKTDKEIKKALRDAYPFGERAFHPYKIWCDEINVQRGKRIFGARKKDPAQRNPNQQNLFDDLSK